MGTLDLFGNPVRMRIVHALDGGRELTTAQLRARLPDAEISMITLPLLADLARRLPYLDRVWTFPGFPGLADHLF